MLTYDDKSLERMYLKGEEINENMKIYRPPKYIPEFKLLRIEINEINKKINWKTDSSSILIIIHGNGL
jgi:hypothetical protein